MQFGLGLKVGNVNKFILDKVKKNWFIGTPSFISRVNTNCQPNLIDIVLVFYFSVGRFKKRSSTNKVLTTKLLVGKQRPSNPQQSKVEGLLCEKRYGGLALIDLKKGIFSFLIK
jgi:hypothetical protein